MRLRCSSTYAFRLNSYTPRTLYHYVFGVLCENERVVRCVVHVRRGVMRGIFFIVRFVGDIPQFSVRGDTQSDVRLEFYVRRGIYAAAHFDNPAARFVRRRYRGVDRRAVSREIGSGRSAVSSYIENTLLFREVFRAVRNILVARYVGKEKPFLVHIVFALERRALHVKGGGFYIHRGDEGAESDTRKQYRAEDDSHRYFQFPFHREVSFPKNIYARTMRGRMRSAYSV